MNYSEYGKELKKILIDKNYRIYDLASALSVSSAFISSIITGKKNVPEDFNEKIAKVLSLSTEEKEMLDTKAALSRDLIKIDLTMCNQTAKNTVLAFQRNLNSLDEETLEKINEILNNRGDK